MRIFLPRSHLATIQKEPKPKMLLIFWPSETSSSLRPPFPKCTTVKHIPTNKEVSIHLLSQTYWYTFFRLPELMKSIKDLHLIAFDYIMAKDDHVALRFSAEGSHNGESYKSNHKIFLNLLLLTPFQILRLQDARPNGQRLDYSNWKMERLNCELLSLSLRPYIR
jgi:hypothetical protein